jgi:hypothetical protein
MKTKYTNRLQVCAVIILIAMFIAAPSTLVAQNAGTASSNSASDSSTNAANAEILQELARMKSRIQELENRLKLKETEPATAVESSSRPGVEQNSTSPSSTALLTQPTPPAEGAKPAEKPAKAAPFAFAIGPG